MLFLFYFILFNINCSEPDTPEAFTFYFNNEKHTVWVSCTDKIPSGKDFSYVFRDKETSDLLSVCSGLDVFFKRGLLGKAIYKNDGFRSFLIKKGFSEAMVAEMVSVYHDESASDDPEQREDTNFGGKIVSFIFKKFK
jgi:hypothetical protein